MMKLYKFRQRTSDAELSRLLEIIKTKDIAFSHARVDGNRVTI